MLGSKKSIPTALFVPLGGWGMSFVNKYTKMAAYDLWTFITQSRAGKYSFSEGQQLAVRRQSENADTHANVLKYWDAYNTWHIHYKEDRQPFNAFLCTQRGFFHINLYSWNILKALPAEKPMLSTSIESVYSDLNQNMASSTTADDKRKLEKLQLVCLLNMLLKDLAAIMNFTGYHRVDIPEIFRRMIQGLNSLQDEASIDLKTFKHILDGKPDEWNTAKGFLEKYSDKMSRSSDSVLFYRKHPPSQEESIRTTANMGMVFQYNVNNAIVLSITDEDNRNKLLKESVLMTGEWACVFKLQYFINA
jgi:hypothetical protein